MNYKIKIFKPRIDKKLILAKDKPAPFPETPTILYLGSHAAHKRIEMLIEAYIMVLGTPQRPRPQRIRASVSGGSPFGPPSQESQVKTKLVIAGKETLYTPKIREFISQLPEQVKKQIDFRGEYNKKDHLKLLDQATVLVNPSEHESLGLVFLEAWVRKKPVIGADLPPLKEVICDGEDGLLFEKNSIDDLSAKIKQIIENPEMARKMGERGYE